MSFSGRTQKSYTAFSLILNVVFVKLQRTEEEYFCNRTHSPGMTEFLELLGNQVHLKNFKGYIAELNNFVKLLL